MEKKLSEEIYQTAPRKPNFLLIVVLSGIMIVVMFAAALLLLTDTGKKLLPKLHHNPEPTSFLMQPARDLRNS